MTPKEKAKELINKFNHVNSKNYINDDGLWDTEFGITNDDAKEFALIAIDEILDVCKTYLSSYYLEVKKEIEKL